MEVVAASSTNGTPFHNHDIREWSRLDSLTGVLERARLETDHWTANTANASHKYNKVVDSRARSGADGNLQQQARRKLEVFQSQIPGGRLQVIKTQTVSSSRWTNQSPQLAHSEANNEDNEFEDLKLSLNPLDLSSEKSKASVGRSGRRPPSRSRIRDDILSRDPHTVAATNLHRVSRLCHQIHDNAVKRSFTRNSLPIEERRNGDGIGILEQKSERRSLIRTKSTSSEELHDPKKSIEDLQDLEQLQNWRRTSKLRRSLQYPKQKILNSKPPDLPENSVNVRKIREDLETDRRLSTALRGNNVDLEALDQILKSISNSSVSSSSYSDNRFEEPEKDNNKTKQKRNSFVTVESIQAVRGRLRRTSSPGSDLYKKESEEIDDGIVTEDRQSTEMGETRVKSYVFGMENLNKKNISGTGSLESRSKPGNLFINRNEDWFLRRKSYGFEQMHSQQETMSSKNKSRVESSTDSGICRSSEIVVIPTATKTNFKYSSDSEEDTKHQFSNEENISNVKKYAMIFENKKKETYSSHKAQNDLNWNKRDVGDKDIEATTITIPIISNSRWPENGEIKRHSIAVDESKYMRNKTENKFKRTSLVINDPSEDDEDSNHKKHNKKVEFCKTEVHFAADSGRVNIVETDEKPPPTQNFRRRRRNPGITEDFNKNGLPMIHFGDTSYEKLLFGETDNTKESENNGSVYNDKIYEEQEVVISGNVTVNANGNGIQDYDELKECIENEAPKGILKNKPIKPKPYILGDNSDVIRASDSDSEKTWGVKLRPTQKEETPVWRSTVTVKNTFFDEPAQRVIDDQPEFQEKLKQLRPTSKKVDDETKRCSDGFNNIRIISPVVDTRRSSWSVADRVKQVEDLKWTENKGYSTKVNFGESETTVVENRHPTWPRQQEYTKDMKKNLLNKSLVVRIGRNDTQSMHTVCAKTTTNSDTNGITTTTKITIDLTPSPTQDEGSFKFPRAQLQNFKSPSLIMNTLKNDNATTNGVIQDKPKIPQQLEVLRKLYEEVHSDSEADKEVHRILMNKEDKSDGSSVVSGSWSKMRAFKHINHYQKSITTNGSHALVEKGTNPLRLSETTKGTNAKFQYIDEQIENNLKYLNNEVELLNKTQFSEISPRKVNIKSNDKLSSPYLVCQNETHSQSYSSDQEVIQINQHKFDNLTVAADKTIASVSPKISTRSKSPIKDKVLRQPKKSEMAYFGVKVPAKTTHIESMSEKPDLLQFNSHGNINKTKTKVSPKISTPIYENLEATTKKTNTFDSSILEELTKAADQILQAVNGYTDEEYHSKFTSEDEKPKREVLDTISETKSWKQNNKMRTVSNTSNKIAITKNKTKQTSSNSSVESIIRECKKLSTSVDQQKTYMTKSAEQKQRKKVVGNDVAKATTKARRLQRASSREALLQSHGSSSEDLAANIEIIRKPRLTRKTKSTQLTITNGVELKKPVKKREEPKIKTDDRVSTIGLPEIRHKTAISTIRSTAEKAASREKTKQKTDELKKKQITKKDAGRVGTTSVIKPERIRSTMSREINHNRHTSANNPKKSSRTETLTKH